jgi:hypothetical protein
MLFIASVKRTTPRTRVQQRAISQHHAGAHVKDCIADVCITYALMYDVIEHSYS